MKSRTQLWWTKRFLLFTVIALLCKTVTADPIIITEATPERLIELASALVQGEDYNAAGSILRQFRLQFPESALLADALLISANIAKKEGDTYQELYFLQELKTVSSGLSENQILSITAAKNYQLISARRLGELHQQSRDYDLALSHYRTAIAILAARQTTINNNKRNDETLIRMTAELSAIRLKAAQICFYREICQPGDVSRFFNRIKASVLNDGMFIEYQALSRELMWNYLGADQLGLDDNNISAVATDGDDVWVGSWNGGLVRYTRSTGYQEVYSDGPDSLVSRRIRDIKIIDRYVWVGTDQGLSIFSRSSNRWRYEIISQNRSESVLISTIVVDGDVVYVGTLGEGLWRHKVDGWEKIIGSNSDGLPGKFINTLRIIDQKLWIGTIDLGLLVMDLQDQSLESFDVYNENLGPKNVTAIIPEGDNYFWITTFGDGIFRWHKGLNQITQFNSSNSPLPDDWVLAGTMSDYGLYFGTFGGGAIRYSPNNNSWTPISLKEGLPSLNVAVINGARGEIFFGTLGGGVAILSEALSVYGL